MKASQLLQQCLSTLKPPRELALSDWFEENIVLTSGAKKGKWDRTYAAYQAGIMDAISDPRYEKVVVCKSGQSGITTVGLAGYMLYSIFHRPSDICYIRPSISDAKNFSKMELKNLLDGNKKFSKFFKDNKGKEGSNTIQIKIFPGGSLRLLGSGSANQIAGFSVQVMLMDEVSKFEALKEGNVIDLADTRTKTWEGRGRKIVYVSTPELAGNPNDVYEIYKTHSNMGEFHVPCPKCGLFQVIRMGNVKYSHCLPALDDIYIECINPECKAHINEKQRLIAVRKGKWVFTRPEITDFAGFQFSDLISPFGCAADGGGLKSIVKKWIGIGTDNLKRKNFINETLGEAWEERLENKISDDMLYNRREKYDDLIPWGVGMLTMGVDVQDNRLEYSIWGWGLNDEAWLIEHKIIMGSPGLDEVWDVLNKAIYKTYPHASGIQIPLDRVCIDTGGHFTSKVYGYVHKKGPVVVPIKGAEAVGTPMIPAKGVRSGPRSITRFDLGTLTIKDQIFSYLQNPNEGPGYIHFPEHPDADHSENDVEYFKQLTAEVPSYRYVSGQKTKYYRQIRDRNEALDCMVYAYGGFKMVNFNNLLEKRLAGLEYQPPVEPEEPTPAPEQQPEAPQPQPQPQPKAPIPAIPAPKRAPYQLPALKPYRF